MLTSYWSISKTTETDTSRRRPRSQVPRPRLQNSGLKTKTAVSRTTSLMVHSHPSLYLSSCGGYWLPQGTGVKGAMCHLSRVWWWAKKLMRPGHHLGSFVLIAGRGPAYSGPQHWDLIVVRYMQCWVITHYKSNALLFGVTSPVTRYYLLINCEQCLVVNDVLFWFFVDLCLVLCCK